jgi:hypothetical protein
MPDDRNTAGGWKRWKEDTDIQRIYPTYPQDTIRKEAKQTSCILNRKLAKQEV